METFESVTSSINYSYIINKLLSLFHGGLMNLYILDPQQTLLFSTHVLHHFDKGTKVKESFEAHLYLSICNLGFQFLLTPELQCAIWPLNFCIFFKSWIVILHPCIAFKANKYTLFCFVFYLQKIRPFKGKMACSKLFSTSRCTVYTVHVQQRQKNRPGISNTLEHLYYNTSLGKVRKPRHRYL